MHIIHPTGSFLKTDANGCLISGASLDKIVAPWKEAVDTAVQHEVRRLGSRLHSLYLRGSVARGKAISGRSDIDLFAVLFDDDGALDQPQPWSEQELRDFQRKFPFLSSIECSNIGLSQVYGPFHYYRFVMKVSSVCVHGIDLLPTIENYTPDAPIAEEWFRILPHLVSRFEREIQQSTDTAHSERLCMDIMKTFLRSGMLLAMRRRAAYTRDLYPSYQVFSDLYPEQEPAMRRCLELAVNPISDARILLPFVTGFAAWMQEAAEAQLGVMELLPASLVG